MVEPIPSLQPGKTHVRAEGWVKGAVCLGHSVPARVFPKDCSPCEAYTRAEDNCWLPSQPSDPAMVEMICTGKGRKTAIFLLLLVGLLKQLTDRCKNKYITQVQDRKDGAEKNAVSSYRLWRDCAYTPTHLLIGLGNQKRER